MVNLDTMIVHQQGEALPIAQMFDENGNDTNDPDEAVVVVYGRDESFWSVDLREGVTRH